MNQDIFEGIGLSPNESKIYLALVARGESTISEIAVDGGIHRRNVYDAMERLIDKGLVFPILSPSENRYNAVDPDKLLELIDERRGRIEAALPELRRKFIHREAPEEAYIYRGFEGQKNIWREVLRVGKTSYFIGAKGGWFDPRLDAGRNAFFREAKRKNIDFIQLFDNEVLQKIPGFPQHFPGQLKYRFLPPEYSTNSGVHIFGDYVVTYTGLSIGRTDENTIFFVIRSKHLAESYRTWFQYMWDRSVEPRKTTKKNKKANWAV